LMEKLQQALAESRLADWAAAYHAACQAGNDGLVPA
jgi:hypothetical protein